MCTSAITYSLALGPESNAGHIKFTSADTTLQSSTNTVLRDLFKVSELLHRTGAIASCQLERLEFLPHTPKQTFEISIKT